MREITLRCAVCGYEEKDKLPSSKSGTRCPKCSKGALQRVFKDVRSHDIVSDMMIDVSQKMLYS